LILFLLTWQLWKLDFMFVNTFVENSDKPVRSQLPSWLGDHGYRLVPFFLCFPTTYFDSSLVKLFLCGEDGQSLRVLEGCVLISMDDIGVLSPAATSYLIATFPVRLHFSIYWDTLLFKYKDFAVWDISEGCTQRFIPEPKQKLKYRKWNQWRSMWCNEARSFPMANFFCWQCQGVQVRH
jgi:hypothetical protein